VPVQILKPSEKRDSLIQKTVYDFESRVTMADGPRRDPDRLPSRAMKGLMMTYPATSEPDAWALFCRHQLRTDVGMLHALATRSDAVKKASAEEAAEDKKRMAAVDAEVADQMRVREVQYWWNKEVQASTRTVQIESFSEKLGEPYPPTEQKVVPLRRSATINAVPRPTYFSLAWSDAITENMECIDRIARALEAENGGKRSKRYEKLLLQKYFETLGSPKAGSIGRSGYPEHIEKRVNRYLWLEQAFESGKVVYPKGYPTPLSLDERETLQNKLRAASVPKDGIQQLISSLRKFIKRNSKRPQRH
jgi:hypothetical protein